MIASLLACFGLYVHVVPYAQMRYPSAGDWLTDETGIRIIVADTGSWRCNFLVALHEIVEAWLCRRHGITQEEVDQWDMVTWPKYMKTSQTRQIDSDEPGDHPNCPYRREHRIASRVERVASWLLLVNWTKYEQRLEALNG